jgi:hypothetical protein
MRRAIPTAADFFAHPPAPGGEAAFWHALKLPNDVRKTTHAHRFAAFDAAIGEYWRQAGFVPRRALDVGVSSGVTTAEWLEAMRAASWSPEMVATDIWIEATLVRALPFFRVLLLDNADALPAQYALFGRAVRARLSRNVAASVATVAAAALYRLCRLLSVPMAVERRCRLVSPAVLSRGVISFVEDDVFDADSKVRLGRFDVIRAANILNLAYFPEEEIRAALDNLVGMLNGPGAFLILCRTRGDGSNHGTMFRLNETGALDAVLKVGDGSELAALATTQGSSPIPLRSMEEEPEDG